MAPGTQLMFDWTAAPPPPPPPQRPRRLHPPRIRELEQFVARVRACSLSALRQLKRLVDAAVREEELLITDADIPF